MKVTLKDISEDTGYSISTISRVLNGLDKTSTKARKEIIKSARKLNYPIQKKLDGAAASGILDVLLITGIEIGEFYASFFNGLNNAANREKVRLSLSSLENKVPEIEAIADKIERESFNGLIINVPGFSTDHYKKLKEMLPEDFPVISNEVLNNQVFDAVGFDNYGGGHLVAKHFYDRNYNSCGVIRGPEMKNVSRQRAHGFNDFLKRKPDMDILWEYDGDFSVESGIEAFKAFEKLEDKPRAVFACNDAMCQSFIKEAMVRGYEFPEDIAIVGFDDLPLSSRHNPTISSVHTDYEVLGAVSIQKMKEMLANPDQPKGLLSLVPVTLNVRESS